MGAHQRISAVTEDDLVAPGRRHEVLGIVATTATLLMGLSLASYDARGGENLIGPVGTELSEVLATAFGVAAWLLPIETGLAAVRLFRGRRALLGAATVASTLVLVLVGCAMVHLGLPDRVVFGGHLPGGALGEVLGEVLRSLLGLAGALLVGVTILLVTIVLRTPVSVITMARAAWAWIRDALERVRDGVHDVIEAWREAKELEAQEREAARRAAEPKIIGPGTLPGTTTKPSSRPPKRAAANAKPSVVADVDSDSDADSDAEADAEAELDDVHAKTDPDLESDDEDDVEDDAPAAEPVVVAKPARSAPPAAGPRIVAPIVAPPPAPPAPRAPAEPAPAAKGRPFVLPPTSLLAAPTEDGIRVDPEVLKANAERLTEKLAAYGVRGRVDEIHPGPVVTMYEFEPQSGTKVSKIAGLADDLAMALAAQKVRIVAPIPGKARVGFELPNDHRKTVYLREILEDPRWEQQKGALPMALGQDIAGQPVYADLAKMPHLLVAGATGAGKSVGLNVMLASLLCKKTPEEVRMLMIDPKVVELAVFDGIPHMLLPVVTDMKKAALALRWAVDEMERRYQLFADAGARNIASFNKRVERVLAGEIPIEKFIPSRAGKVRAQGPEGEELFLDPSDDEKPDALKPPTPLPSIVVVVDEFADLMMVAAKDVEACIARLAQKARAAGIHVILATQRPSVDVITGMIKANFPARIGFKVSQREDSKTILGRQGAEHLLGMGDMLMIPPGTSDLKRVHCAFISEDEVKDVCDHLREQGKPVYDEDILKPREDEDGEAIGGAGGGSSDDPLYDRAVAVVAQAGYCSISHIQRQLGVGYNKAAKLVEQMEKEGVVGPPSGKAGGRREVLVQAL